MREPGLWLSQDDVRAIIKLARTTERTLIQRERAMAFDIRADMALIEDYSNIDNPLTLLRSAWLQSAKAYDAMQEPDASEGAAIAHASNAKQAIEQFLSLPISFGS